MRILVDENIPRLTVNYLRQAGHDVTDIRGSADQGLADAALWKGAVSERRLLITTDKGFTEYRNADHSGILIVRLRQPNRTKIHKSVLQGLERYSEAEWPGLLVVVRDSMISTAKTHGSATI